MKAQIKQNKLELESKLKKFIPPNDTVYTILKNVSQSGMYRHIQVIVIKDNKPINLSYWIADYLEWSYKDKTYSIGVGGCGMDMGFHLVYTLSRSLFDDGYSLRHEWL